MSTRANIVIKDEYDKIWFYRHSDGYPEGALPTLKKFMKWVKEGKLRDNANQSAGWLILIGADEYGYNHDFKEDEYVKTRKSEKEILEPSSGNSCSGWKVGAYEPTTRQHADVQYIYILDLCKKTITVKEGYDKSWKKIDFITNFN